MRASPSATPAPEQSRRQRRILAVGLLALAATATALIIVLASQGSAGTRRAVSLAAPPAKTPKAVAAPSSFAVGLRVLQLQDASRLIHLSSGATEPRTLLTYVRYPAVGAPSASDVPNAPAAPLGGPFPLVIFGHGFAVTPDPYKRLLQAWARAGYVVAAPVFPLGNANAPGGPEERDLVNQPADMSFVISRMLAESSAGARPLKGLIDPAQIAVTGHSDGGDTALAVAYDHDFRDSRVRAAIILAGAQIPGVAGPTFPSGAPPLLAVQGSADTINPPSLTEAFYKPASRPKYLLNLPGAEHLPPFSDQQPQLGTVEHVTTAFLDLYLKHKSGASQRLHALGNVGGTAALVAEP
jgi:predicted dienelactone hydrolase